MGCIKKPVFPVITRYHTENKRDVSSSLKIRTLSRIKQIGWKGKKWLSLVLLIVLILKEHSILYYIHFSFYIKGQDFNYKLSVDCSILHCTHSPLHSYDRCWLKVRKKWSPKKHHLMKGDLIWYLDSLSYQRFQSTIDLMCFC